MQAYHLMPIHTRSIAAAGRTLIALLVVITCRGDQGPEAPIERVADARPSFSTVPGAVTLVGAGNIARCDRTNDDATANLLDAIPGTVFALGGAATKRAPTRRRVITNTTRAAPRRATSATSARPPATRPRAITATISAPGISSS